MEELPRRLPVSARVILFGVTGICVTAALYLLTREGRHGDPVRFDPAIGLLVLGWLTAGVAAVGSWPRRQWLSFAFSSLRASLSRQLPAAVLLVLVLVVAAVFRILPLGQIPPPGITWYEEIQTGGNAAGILQGYARPLDYPLVNYGTALSFWLLGPSTLSLRLPFIFLGWITVGLFFATARHLFRGSVALFVTAMFAVSRWHIHINHVVDENGPPLVLMMAVLYLVVSSSSRGGVARFYLLGTLLGLTLYVYPGYRFLLVLVPLYFASRFVIRRVRRIPDPSDRNRRLAAAAGLLIAMSIVLVPLVEAAVEGDQRASILYDLRRDHSIAVPVISDGDWDRTARLANTVFRFIFVDLSCEWVSAGGRPALEPIVAVLSLLGLGWAVLTPSRPGRWMLAFWVPVVTYLGTIAIGATYLHRLCAIVPMLYLLIGPPFEDLSRLIEERRARWWGTALGATMAVLFAVEATGNVETLFIQYPRDLRVQHLFEDASRELPIRAGELSEGRTVYLWSDLRDPIHYFRGSETSWLTGVLNGRPMLSLFDPLPVRGGFPKDGALLGLRLFRGTFTPRQVDGMAAYFYPEIVEGAIHETSAHERIDYLYYPLPSSAVRSRWGLHGALFDRGGNADTPVMARVDSLDGSPISNPPGDPNRIMDGVWTGFAWVEATGEYVFRIDGRGSVVLRVNGSRVVEGEARNGPSGTVALGRGWQVVQLEGLGVPVSEPPRLMSGQVGKQPAVFAAGDLYATKELRGLVRTWTVRREGVESVYLRRIEPTVSHHMVEPLMRQVEDEIQGTELVRERWEGWLEVDRDTEMRFRVHSRQGRSRLEIDGDTILVVPKPDYAGVIRNEITVKVRGGVRHLVITFDYEFHGDFHGGVELGWSEGPTALMLLPTDRLSPIPPAAVVSRPGG